MIGPEQTAFSKEFKLKVKWVRWKSAEDIIHRFFRGMNMRKPAEDIVEYPMMLESLQRDKMWAFVDSKATPAVVHYWCDGVDPLELAFMLGHELGHLSGKPLVSRRNFLREELRANEYGAVAREVFKVLKKEKLL